MNTLHGFGRVHPASRMRGARLVVCVLSLWLGACEPAAQREADPSPVETAVPVNFDTRAELLDRVTTAAAVFETPAEKHLYRAAPAVIEGGERRYEFWLLPQPSMDESQHFRLITVTWAPRGHFKAARAGKAEPDVGGLEARAETPDRALEVRVALGELLPGDVQAPDVDLQRAANELVRRYESAP